MSNKKDKYRTRHEVVSLRNGRMNRAKRGRTALEVFVCKSQISAAHIIECRRSQMFMRLVVTACLVLCALPADGQTVKLPFLHPNKMSNGANIFLKDSYGILFFDPTKVTAIHVGLVKADPIHIWESNVYGISEQGVALGVSAEDFLKELKICSRFVRLRSIRNGDLLYLKATTIQVIRKSSSNGISEIAPGPNASTHWQVMDSADGIKSLIEIKRSRDDSQPHREDACEFDEDAQQLSRR
jgi:hypothetical protein